MSNKAIFITFDGLTDPLGQSQILPYLIGLAKNDWQIEIISCEKKQKLNESELLVRNQLKSLNMGWQYLIYDEKGNALSRYQYIQTLYKFAQSSIHKQQPDLIHCRSYLATLIGLKIKRKYGIPFIFDMRGFWADERIDGGIWTSTKFLHKLMYSYFKKKEKQFTYESNAIVSLTQRGLEELNRLYPAAKVFTKTTLIACCTDANLFNPANAQPAELKGLKENSHLLVYSGSIGTWYCTREMIECLLLWQKTIPQLQLLILTKDLDELNKQLSDLTIPPNFILTASCSRQQVPSYLALARAAIFFIRPVYSKIASSPTKMAECLAMDLPIITNTGIGDNDLIFKKYTAGVLLSEFSAAGYEYALHDYLKLPEQKGIYRSIAISDFELNTAINRYLHIYQSIANKK